MRLIVKLNVKSPGSISEIRQILVGEEGVTLGRKRGGLKISDCRCSRKHASLYVGQDGRLYVQDLKSSNGTFVNGRRVGRVSVDGGMILRVGRTHVLILAVKSEYLSKVQMS